MVSERAFGFIRCQGTRLEYFFHRTGLEDGERFETLTKGQPVSFIINEASPKGPRAEAVRTGSGVGI